MLHLHIGVKPADLNMFFRRLWTLKLRAIVDGDGWNAWGESVGVNGNDADTLHIIIAVKDVATAKKVIDIAPPLVSSSMGRTSVLTPEADWSIDVPR